MSVPREELKATLEARRELGAELEPQLVESFLDKIDRGLDERIDAKLAGRRVSRKQDNHEFELAVVSVSFGTALPLGAMAFGPGTA